MATYFISYTSRSEKDKKWADWIEYVLRVIVGGKTIMQKYDFQVGDNFKAKMDDALKEADSVVCVLTETYLQSSNCREEWINADRIIPVKFDNCDIKGLLKYRVYIDLFGLDKDAAREKFVEELKEKIRSTTEPDFPVASDTVKPTEPEYPTPAKNNLPDPNPSFTGREKLLQDIENGLQERSIVIVKGQGGYGKTQTAIAYAYAHITDYEVIWIFNAESKECLQDDYHAFAIRFAGLPSAQPADFSVVRSCMDLWLSKNTSYLFIYENTEDTEVIPNLRDFLPLRGRHGQILINTKKKLNGLSAEMLDINIFTKPEALAFFEKRLGIVDKTECLAELLGCLPLALDQAAAYIKENKYTVGGYIELFKKHGLRVLNDVSPNSDYNKTVLTTWAVTLEKIEKDKDAAASLQLFKLMAFCAPDDIPLQMFIKGREHLPLPLQDALDPDDPLSHDELIGHLKKYSLVSFRRSEYGNALLSVHRLMQAVVAGEMEGREEYLRVCLDVTVNAFDDSFATREDFETFAAVVPHTLEIARHAEDFFKDDDEAAIIIADIYHRAGFGYDKQGNYPTALEWYNKALVIYEKVLGTEHPYTAMSYNNIAGLYDIQGNYAMALEWYIKALEIDEKVMGIEHPDTAMSFNNIGLVYHKQGYYSAALEWYNKALVICEKVQGRDHPSTATTYSSIAGVYNSQGNYPASLEWYNKALVIREKVLGAEHPFTATTYNNIALIYSKQGNYSAALEWYSKALAIREKVLGTEHPDTAVSYNNIAGVYNEEGDYPAALEGFNKALKINEKVLGTEHPSTATDYSNIAHVYSSQGDYPAALEWYNKALAIYDKVLGKEHPDTATSYNNIAVVYGNQGDYSAALEWFNKALVICEKVLGVEHPDTAITYNNIASVYYEKRNFPTALKWYRMALAIFEKMLGSEHPNTKAVETV